MLWITILYIAESGVAGDFSDVVLVSSSVFDSDHLVCYADKEKERIDEDDKRIENDDNEIFWILKTWVQNFR